ncbi:ribosome-inactivating family protein [Streptomyces sp. NPDC001985]|uniref:ribosome-inactivating family protein n=1 Tax=Streptomyces sp. NPDC001985 TaxID=3154406 RepID=UPI003323F096
MKPFFRSHAIRFLAILTAIAALLGGTQLVSALPAQAATSHHWNVMNWNITNLGNGNNIAAANRYRSMLSELRNLSAHNVTNGFMRTMTETERYAEIRVIDNNNISAPHRLTIYVRLDNLYVDAFTANGSTFAFNDTPGYFATRFFNAYPGGNTLVRTMPFSGAYGSLDADQNRANRDYRGPSFGAAISDLQNMNSNNFSARKFAMAVLIGAVSEAARFGWIESRIAMSISHNGELDGTNRYYHIGGFGISLQNNWSSLSRLVYRELNNTEHYPVQINGHNYTSTGMIRHGSSTAPAIGLLVTYGGAR